MFFGCLISRCLSTNVLLRAETKAAEVGEKKPKGPPVINKSFVTNMFRGEVVTKEVFPFPYYIEDEQRDNIAAFVDPVTAFFTVSDLRGLRDY